MGEPDEVLAKLREAWRYAVRASESLQSAKDSEALRERMILKADEELKEAFAAIADLGQMAESNQLGGYGVIKRESR